MLVGAVALQSASAWALLSPSPASTRRVYPASSTCHVSPSREPFRDASDKLRSRRTPAESAD